MIRRLHPLAGGIAFLAILSFWTSTVVAELFCDGAAVARVKSAILCGLLVLVPAMIVVGATGFRMGGRSPQPLIVAKRRRMPIIALNGLLVLVPCAVFLQARAVAGNFDTAFVLVQGVELVAGAVNLVLMGLSIRDGLALRRRAHMAAA